MSVFFTAKTPPAPAPGAPCVNRQSRNPGAVSPFLVLSLTKSLYLYWEIKHVGTIQENEKAYYINIYIIIDHICNP